MDKQKAAFGKNIPGVPGNNPMMVCRCKRGISTLFNYAFGIGLVLLIQHTNADFCTGIVLHYIGLVKFELVNQWHDKYHGITTDAAIINFFFFQLSICIIIYNLVSN